MILLPSTLILLPVQNAHFILQTRLFVTANYLALPVVFVGTGGSFFRTTEVTMFLRACPLAWRVVSTLAPAPGPRQALGPLNMRLQPCSMCLVLNMKLSVFNDNECIPGVGRYSCMNCRRAHVYASLCASIHFKTYYEYRHPHNIKQLYIHIYTESTSNIDDCMYSCTLQMSMDLH